MSDLDKIYDCILDKTYQNKSQLEIILSHIEDRELVVGFIFDMLLKHSTYEVDKQSMLELMAETLGEMTPREYIKDCHNTFTKKIKKINEDSLSGNIFIVDAISALYNGTIVEFEKVVSKCENKDNLNKLKNHLLDAELYEFIGLVDKYLL